MANTYSGGYIGAPQIFKPRETVWQRELKNFLPPKYYKSLKEFDRSSILDQLYSYLDMTNDTSEILAIYDAIDFVEETMVCKKKVR